MWRHQLTEDWPGRRCWQWGRLCCPPHCRKWRADGPVGRALAQEDGYLSRNETEHVDIIFNRLHLKPISVKASVMLGWSPSHFSLRSLFFLFYRDAVGKKQRNIKLINSHKSNNLICINRKLTICLKGLHRLYNIQHILSLDPWKGLR